MKRVVIIIILLTTGFLLNNTLSAQMFGSKPMPPIAPGSDIVDPPYKGERGWHTVHRKTPNKLLIKKRPTRKTDICLSCHIKENKIFDPHTQLTRKGIIIQEKCLYCHLEKPDEKHSTFETNKTEVKFKGNIDDLCTGCHSRKYVIAHPVNAMHLLKPSVDILSRMKASELEFNIVLPLDYNGKIMCATCHNPHQKGVMPSERIAARGASEKFRVRLPGRAPAAAYTRISTKMDRICLTCHKDKEYEKTEFSFE